MKETWFRDFFLGGSFPKSRMGFTDTVAHFRDEVGWSIMLTGYQEGLGWAWYGEYHCGSLTGPECREFEIETTMQIMRFEGVSKWYIIFLASYQESGCLWHLIRRFFFKVFFSSLPGRDFSSNASSETTTHHDAVPSKTWAIGGLCVDGSRLRFWTMWPVAGVPVEPVDLLVDPGWCLWQVAGLQQGIFSSERWLDDRTFVGE